MQYVTEERFTEQGSKRMTTFVHGTVDDFVRNGEARNLEQLASVDSVKRFSSRKEDRDWTGTATYEEAADLALNGWHEGVKRLTDLRDELMAEIGALVPEPMPIHDVEGYDVDVAAYLSGEPESMINMMDFEQGNRQIRVLVNLSAHAGRTRESLMMRGLLAAGVVDSLEAMGHRVTLDVVSIHKSRENIAMLAHVKRASDVLDLERMAFAVGHPSMLRRINFAMMEARPKHRREAIGVPGGYGQPSDDYQNCVPKEYHPDLYIGTGNEAETMSEVRDSIIDYLKKGGVLSE